METILSFFSDLILFTAGLVVVALWIGLLVLAFIEAVDLVVESRKKKSKED